MTAADPTPPARRGKRRLLFWLGLLLGTVLAAALVAREGAEEIAAAFAVGGWALLWLVLLHPIHLVPLSEAWRVLFPKRLRPGFWPCLNAMFMGQGVNTLLPVATIGGEVVKARVLSIWGTPSDAAAASVVVDKTAQSLALLGLFAIGIPMLVVLNPRPDLVLGASLVAVLLGLGIAGFIQVQRSGPAGLTGRALTRFGAGGLAERISGAGDGFDGHLRDAYARPWSLLGGVLLRVASAVALSVEVWLAAQLLGHDLSLWDAVLIRVLSTAVRGAAFFVWGGVGVQEAAFVALGASVGVPGEVMLSISIASRLREVLTAIPGVLWWQAVEGRRAFRRQDSDPGS